LSPGDLRGFLLTHGVDPVAVQQRLARPTRGSEGEDAINKLATDRPAEFSAGFVSLAAALLLASNLFRDLFFADIAPPRLSMITLTFLKGALERGDLAVDDHCGTGLHAPSTGPTIAWPGASRTGPARGLRRSRLGKLSRVATPEGQAWVSTIVKAAFEGRLIILPTEAVNPLGAR